MCNQSCLIVSNENAKKAVASATVFFLSIVIPHWRMADRPPGRGCGNRGDHCAVRPAGFPPFGAGRRQAH